MLRKRNTTGAASPSYQHLRMEKLVAELLIDLHWASGKEPVPPQGMHAVKGGKFPPRETTPFRIDPVDWIMLPHNSPEPRRLFRRLCYILLVFAACYALATIVLLLLYP